MVSAACRKVLADCTACLLEVSRAFQVDEPRNAVRERPDKVRERKDHTALHTASAANNRRYLVRPCAARIGQAVGLGRGTKHMRRRATEVTHSNDCRHDRPQGVQDVGGDARESAHVTILTLHVTRHTFSPFFWRLFDFFLQGLWFTFFGFKVRV